MSTIEKAVEKLGKKSQKSDSAAPTSSSPEAGVNFTSEPDSQGFFDKAVESSAGAAPSASHSEKKSIVLPIKELEAKGFVSPYKPRSYIAEEYRAIKRPLLQNIDTNMAQGTDHANLIMVTSSFEGEGKTFSAINLMLSISIEKDKTVLFVDADMAKASAGSLLGIPDDTPGLIDVLEDENIGIEDVLLNTDLPNVRIIPVGIAHERSTELLASERMKQLMAELSARYPDRVIIFDSPPFLQTSEAAVLADCMGQIVFVVEAEKVSPDVVKQAVSRISDDKIIGMLLNKAVRYPWDNYTHGYGYGYGHSYGAGRTRIGGDQNE